MTTETRRRQAATAVNRVLVLKTEGKRGVGILSSGDSVLTVVESPAMEVEVAE